MKSIHIITALAILTLFSASCKKINNAGDAEKAGSYQVNITAPSQLAGVTSTQGLKIVFENFAEGFKLEKELGANITTIDGLIPGIYSINISGRVEDGAGDAFYLSGSKINYAIVKNGEAIEIPVNGLKVSPLIISEIFYAGTGASPVPGTGTYFRNQFYEIYNNSDKVIYLDGLCFANLTPTTATTTLPLWPAADGSDYAYAERIWKVPGTGTQYPLQAGESFVISQFAANHKLPQYNVNSPVDGSSSEFEFNMNNANFPDQPAVDMEHVFYNASASKGTLPQYLTSVFGGAYVIFKVPAGETYDPVNNANLRTRNLAGTATMQYAKVPIRYILDAVEAGNNENLINAKRVPSVLDAGMTYVGATYNSLGVARKVAVVNADGTPILMDTNNSTNDFERGVVPQFRRHGSRMPSWNHTIK
ncbi:DUF4876 domain-containing protein [Pedobacter metabolipauper]|uniref:Uncharacterized protein DUF4876 n=1 Tax=Pedobacter metabolipauper TaxID=425513 RepID=A0A4R6SZY1_9SPHI|nr:DUF4876 domain-containing protein [Pedobacter metabolipauper]TDQ12036.1 uncharacterized protein DUF4876 [Pedobacter metabolipauper]